MDSILPWLQRSRSAQRQRRCPAAAAPALQPGMQRSKQQNDMVSIRHQGRRATWCMVPTINWRSRPTLPNTRSISAVVLGTGGEANGYVTLLMSDKIRTLLKMIPLPKKMSQTPDQAEEFNVYSYLKQLIDGNDVSVLLRVADEVVSVMDTIHFYVPPGGAGGQAACAWR